VNSKLWLLLAEQSRLLLILAGRTHNSTELAGRIPQRENLKKTVRFKGWKP